MKIPLVDVKLEYIKHKDEIDDSIAKVLAKGSFILGDEVEQFEENFAKFCNAKYCVGLDSGMSALELGIRALGIGTGDEVITPVNSFIASSSAISFTGAKPVWVDMDLESYNIDVKKIENVITKKTKAIMPVHLYGQSANLDVILKLAKKYKLLVIEDACQAHGAEYKGKKVGSFGDFAAFSFYPGKNLGAFGDAGAIVTNNKKMYEIVRQMRNYGQIKKYHHKFLAWNRRLDNLQAAVLNIKLKYLKENNKKRQKAAKIYTTILNKTNILTPKVMKDRTHVFHLYVIQVPERDKLFKHLLDEGIQVGIHYPVPIHLQEAYKKFKFKEGSFSATEDFSKKIISLPLFPSISDEQIKFICDSVNNFYEK